MNFSNFLIAALFFHSATIGAARDELDRKIEQSFGEKASDDDLVWITDEIRPIVLQRLLERVQAIREKKTNRGSYEEGLLARMGHMETLERLAAEMNQPGDGSALERTGTELAIPYLMPMVYTSSTEMPKRVDDVVETPVRSRYARCVADIIARREAFPAATREWAEHMRNGIAYAPPEGRIDLLKKWWEKNQTAIIEKRYADATWLPALYKGKPSYLSDEEIKDRKADQERQRLVRQTKRNDDAIPAAGETTNNSPNQTLWGVLAALGLLLIGLAGWKFKGRTPR